MKSMILVAALACLSVAVAQQSTSTQKPSSKTTSTTPATAPSDAASNKTTVKKDAPKGGVMGQDDQRRQRQQSQPE